MTNRVENINTEILRQCRTQIGLELSEVEKRIKKIAEIEQGKQKPTFKQLDTLSKLYKVPRWVFISEQLPKKYSFGKASPVFRQFAGDDTEIFNNPKIRGLVAQVERFRELMLELISDIGEAPASFTPPALSANIEPESAAAQIRDWLNLSEDNLSFTEWKELLENKGVFVFMTSKYKGWSHVDSVLLRGLAIYHSTLPIIIINNSDAKKAQSFTLLHELGHLLKKENAIDDWEYSQRQTEKWCDEFAGNVLMPVSIFREAARKINDLDAIKRIANAFKVSAYACLVRLRQLSIIAQNAYEVFETQLKNEYAVMQSQLKGRPGGPKRNRPKEILDQYGRIYTNILFQAYYNQEIGLHKLAQLFDLKKPSYVLEMEKQL